jgi:hypothetical protein
MPKLPSIQFYPGDWLRDPVAGCSLAAQGLWLRMLLAAHDSPRYGYLCNRNGSPLPPQIIAAKCGCSLEQFQTLLAELDSVSVTSRTKAGTLYSRRMVRDDRKRADWRNRQKKHRLTACHANVTRMSQPSSSSSSNLTTKTPLPPAAAGEEKCFEYFGETIAFQMGRHRRPPSLKGTAGFHAADIVRHLIHQGYPARILEVA